LIKKDREYYSSAYTLKPKYKEQAEAVEGFDDAHFLKHLYLDIFNCGKNLALLKLVDARVS
jgi:hypothetical protein